MNRQDITIPMLKEFISLDPHSGLIYWNERDIIYFKDNRSCRSWNGKNKGKAIGNISPNGYLRVNIFGVAFMVHRIIYAIYYDEWPIGEIDHINHIRDDNRISNLRCCNRVTNSQNLSLKSNNTSGKNGVYRHSNQKVWVVSLRIKGARTHFGNHNNKEFAFLVADEAMSKYGFHKNHGTKL